MAWCWPRGGGSLSAGKKMSERSELFFPEERLPPPRGWQNSRAGVPEAGHPEIKTQKNASPKAGVFRSEVSYLRGSQATEASDAFWVYSSIWSKLRYL